MSRIIHASLACQDESFNELHHESHQPELAPWDEPHLRIPRLEKIRLDEQVIPSLLSASTDRLTRLSFALKSCSTLIQLNAAGNVIRANRCRKRICPICSRVEADEWHYRIKRAVNAMSYNESRHAVMQVTLNAGETCELGHLRQTIQSMHKLWPRLLNTSQLKGRIYGSFRGTEVTVSAGKNGELKGNAHIHGTLILCVTEDEKLEDVVEEITNHIRRYWPKSIRKLIAKDRPAPNTVASVLRTGELYSRSKFDMIEWIRYATKGTTNRLAYDHRHDRSIATTGLMWSAIEEALRNIRLFAATGVLKEELAAIENEPPETVSQAIPDQDQDITPAASFTEADTSRDLLFMWSSPKRNYVKYADFDRDTDTDQSHIVRQIPHYVTNPKLMELYGITEHIHRSLNSSSKPPYSDKDVSYFL